MSFSIHLRLVLFLSQFGQFGPNYFADIFDDHGVLLQIARRV